MKTPLLAASILLSLCACAPDASTDTSRGADAAAPAPPTRAPDSSPSAAATSTPDATVPADAMPTAATGAATAEGAGDKAVNDSIDSNLGDHRRYQAVIRELQAAVAAGDAGRVAPLVQYPLGVEMAGKKTQLKNEKEFIERYPEFMTPDIRSAIVGTKYADLFVNYKGVMFGRGEAWINGICKDEKCDAFDVKLVTLQPGPA